MAEKCSVSGCSSVVYAKELCNMHYWRMHRTGSTAQRATLGLEERVTLRVPVGLARRIWKAAKSEGLTVADWWRSAAARALGDDV